jgi:hypothetical protein
MKKVLIKMGLINMLMMAFIASACASTAGYYRVWQGFKKIELSQEEFKRELPQFMHDTVELYRDRALNQYLVAIPPKNKPDFVPDEFALVALTSEEAYKEIRQTPEGQKYSDRHWDIFNKENSSSAKYHIFHSEGITQLENNHAYDMFGTPLDWTKGHSMFYLGLRKDKVSKKEFLKRLKKHVELAHGNFKLLGLRGYIVIANEDYEVAYMNWESEAHMNEAMSSLIAKSVLEDGAEFMDNFQYQNAQSFLSDDLVTSGAFLKGIY